MKIGQSSRCRGIGASYFAVCITFPDKKDMVLLVPPRFFYRKLDTQNYSKDRMQDPEINLTRIQRQPKKPGSVK